MRVFIIAAIVCFAIAVLAELAVFTGTSVLAWIAGGLLSWAIDSAIGGVGVAWPARRPPQ